jgi:hypothetical protein
MKINDKIIKLINHGLSGDLLSGLNESQVDSLYKRLDESKKENKEQSTPQNTTAQTITTTKYLVKPNSKTMINGVEVDTTGNKTTITPIKETDGTEEEDIALAVSEKDPHLGLAMSKDLKEKFESKSQQKYFWAKCNRSKGKEKEKWCKMADEFSKSTSKKQYEKMPEKKHPEKTVKVKKEQKENYMNMIGKAINKGHLLNLDKVSPSVKWESELEKKIDSIMEETLSPKMSKKDLVDLLSEIKKTKKMLRHKKSNDISEQSPTIAPPKPKTPTKPSKPDTPYSPKPGPKPGPKAKKSEMPNWLKFGRLGINLK